MALPSLQMNGTLPPGEYHATLDDIIATFSPTGVRQNLHQVLQDVLPTIQGLKAQASDMVVYIDGSYITSKPDPSDLDMLIRSDDLFRISLKEDDIRALIWQSSAAARQLVDVFLDHHTTGTMLTLFTQTRSQASKGIIILDF